MINAKEMNKAAFFIGNCYWLIKYINFAG